MLAAILIVFVSILFQNKKNEDGNTSIHKRWIKENNQVIASDMKNIDKNGLELTLKITDAKGNEKTSFESGEAIKVTARLNNESGQESRFLTLKTNLSRLNLYDIRDSSNISGLDEISGKIAIKNIVMYANQTQDFSFIANLNNKTKEEFNLEAALINIDNQTVLKNNPLRYMFNIKKEG
jgi:hypothetical protein